MFARIHSAMLPGKRRVIVGLLLAGLAVASGKPAWGKNGEGLKNAKSGGGGRAKSAVPGKDDLDGDLIDFDSVSPRDCADYLCVSSPDKAAYYIEDGCPGQFATYEPEKEDEARMESLAGFSSSRG